MECTSVLRWRAWSPWYDPQHCRLQPVSQSMYFDILYKVLRNNFSIVIYHHWQWFACSSLWTAHLAKVPVLSLSLSSVFSRTKCAQTPFITTRELVVYLLSCGRKCLYLRNTISVSVQIFYYRNIPMFCSPMSNMGKIRQ